jgi:hypothetical protein
MMLCLDDTTSRCRRAESALKDENVFVKTRQVIRFPKAREVINIIDT